MIRNPEHFTLKTTPEASATICEYLATNCPLSKVKIKDALLKGAVTLKRKKQKYRRIRKATFKIFPGDIIEFHYSRKIIEEKPLVPTLLFNNSIYSVWYKPPGLLSQGTEYGDHCSLERIAKKILQSAKYTAAIHRLDREVGGVVCLAQNQSTAARLSQLFSDSKVAKRYIGIVEGKLGENGQVLEIKKDIDGKRAKTIVTVQKCALDWTMLDIDLHTGRKHQIRKHLSGIGHPLIGDGRYGSKEGRTDIKLLAYALEFCCPQSGEMMRFSVPQEHFDTFKRFP